MEITSSIAGRSVRLTLRGRFDAAWSAHVQDALDACVRAGQHDIELDLARVTFLSSAGIRVLLVSNRQLAAIRGRLLIVEASADVRQVIELSGLRALLAGAQAAAAEPAAAADAAPRTLERPGARFDVRTLDAGARMAVRALGDPGALLNGGALARLQRQAFPPGRLAVGIGAFGAEGDGCRERLGELLAVGGAAITLPTGGEGQPDWLLCEERLVPEAALAYGLVGDGGFAYQARFETDGSCGPLPLTDLVAAALEIAGAGAIALAVVAEAAQFVGAALRRSPAGRAGGIFAFPGVRDQLDFTAEAAHAGSVGVVAGFAARAPAPPALAAQLRPLDRERACAAHLHAAVFPYRPLRRDQTALEESVRGLFESRSVLGLLHLLNDWRPGTGAGQSAFLRGGLWCAPLDPAAEGA